MKTKPKLDTITIRVTPEELAQIRQMGRADLVVLRMVRAALAGGCRVDEIGQQGVVIPEAAPNAVAGLAEASTAATFGKPTQFNASTADMSDSGLSKAFIFWLGNNCHVPQVAGLYKMLEAFGRGESMK